MFPHLYDIIGVGVISEVAATDYLPIPADWTTEELSMFGPPISYTDYEVKFEKVFLDDGTIEANERVILRVYTGYWEISGWPAEQLNDRFLYFLDRIEENADQIPNEAYFSSDGWNLASRIIVDGDEVAYSDSERTLVDFAVGTPPAAFLDAVATEVAAQYPALTVETENPLLVTPWTPEWTPDPYRSPDPTFAPDPVETYAPPAGADEASVNEIIAGFEKSYLNIDRDGLDPATIVFTKTYSIEHPVMLSYSAMTTEQIPEGETRPFILMIVDGGHPDMSRGGGATSMRIVEHQWVIFHQRFGGVVSGHCEELKACIAQFP